ncbi:MAG: Ig-like domain-containing protein [Rubrivivax sp.]|nr:Ig-like domain-containing protein [Rubrivivax sp.]
MEITLSRSSISSANPAIVTAVLKDAAGKGVGGQVISFDVQRGLAVPNVATALTDAAGQAVVILSPTSTTGAGADVVTASASFGGTTVSRDAGFTVQATSVTISAFDPVTPSIGAYGQTSFTLVLDGASVGAPVQVSVSSACVSAGKATLSPSRFTATTTTVTLQYRDNGCGAIQASDTLQAVIDGTANSRTATLNIASPAVASLAFISSAPETIFLRGSGFTEASIVTFEVRDANGSALPNVNVAMRLLTLTGGVTMEGGTAEVVRASDALGRVTVRVNSGTLPTPVRVVATLVGSTISTVSSNLSVAVGLPSQLNFSLSQGTKNIEGYDFDGTPNTYQIIAADRSGNPVPTGTSINFVTEGGQIEAIKQTQLVSGIARTTANFVSSEPRPVDGRVTITAYALGEESFLDLNGNNVRDALEPFQDLGNIFKDRNFDGNYDDVEDEFVPLAVNNASACAAPGNSLLSRDASIPSMPDTCDGVWSGAGQVYVRRATETVLSTSAARPLWANTRGLATNGESGPICASGLEMQVGPLPTQTALFTPVQDDTWYGGITETLSFFVADANPGSVDKSLRPRLNPMAAGTVITATTPTAGLTVSVGSGTPVPSTTERTTTSVVYNFSDLEVFSGVVFVNFRSPLGVNSGVTVNVERAARPTVCP